jgi:sugar (pentulose or hexulose) kinase
LPKQAEQSCADWLAAISTAFCEIAVPLAERYGADWQARVAAIGLTGQLPTLVRIGSDGPQGPAITWKDGRADDWLKSELGALERRQLYERTGMPIDGRYLGPMWSYHHAHASVAPRWLLSAKDYLGWALTGVAATDPSTAAGYAAFDVDSGKFDAALAARWRIPIAALPPVRPASDVLGTLSPAGARMTGLPSGVSVVVGAADSVCSAYAMAGLIEGAACISMGSSTVILDTIRQARRDPGQRYLLTPHVAHGWFAREMDLLATGTGYQWLSTLLNLGEGGLDAVAQRSGPGARGVVFTPYLGGGEQGALWDPTLTGRVEGLTVRHGAADIARAFLEGVCFEVRRCLQVLEETARLDSVLVAGNLVDQPATLQLLADVLGRPVTPVRGVSPAATGAALIARDCATAPCGAPHAHSDAKVVAPAADASTYAGLYRHYLERSTR